jgi:ABC-type amino acid transport substrate-binding protein
MNDLGQAVYLTSQQPDLQVAFGIQGDLRIGVAVNKGEPVLSQALGDAIKIQQESGKATAIMVKYGLDPKLVFPAEIRHQ